MIPCGILEPVTSLGEPEIGEISLWTKKQQKKEKEKKKKKKYRQKQVL